MSLSLVARAFIATVRGAMPALRSALRVKTLDVPTDSRARARNALDAIDDQLRVIAANLDPSSVPPVPTPHVEEGRRLGALAVGSNPGSARSVL